MKVFLTFSLPEEGLELRQALSAGDYHSLLYDLVWAKLRDAVKHGSLDGEYLTAEQVATVDKIRADIFEEIKIRGIKFEA